MESLLDTSLESPAETVGEESCGRGQAWAGLEEVAEHHQGLFHAASRQGKVRLLEGYCPLQEAMDFSAVVLC